MVYGLEYISLSKSKSLFLIVLSPGSKNSTEILHKFALILLGVH